VLTAPGHASPLAPYSPEKYLRTSDDSQTRGIRETIRLMRSGFTKVDWERFVVELNRVNVKEQGGRVGPREKTRPYSTDRLKLERSRAHGPSVASAEVRGASEMGR